LEGGQKTGNISCSQATTAIQKLTSFAGMGFPVVCSSN
jgi:hypothetical protein